MKQIFIVFLLISKFVIEGSIYKGFQFPGIINNPISEPQIYSKRSKRIGAEISTAECLEWIEELLFPNRELFVRPRGT